MRHEARITADITADPAPAALGWGTTLLPCVVAPGGDRLVDVALTPRGRDPHASFRCPGRIAGLVDPHTLRLRIDRALLARGFDGQGWGQGWIEAALLLRDGSGTLRLWGHLDPAPRDGDRREILFHLLCWEAEAMEGHRIGEMR
jgi:hypothetical protein